MISCSYALGCFTAGYYWTVWRTGNDIRRLGGGNSGARNVGRILGPSGFAVTFLFDFTKGAVTTWTAGWLHLSPAAVIAAMVAVVAGHVWPLQLGFHGGKGVATVLGALFCFSGQTVLVGFCVFIPVLLIIRNFTLSGLLAFALTPLAAYYAGCQNWQIAAVSILTLLLLFTHRRNIRQEVAVLSGRQPDVDPAAPPEESQIHER